MRNPLFLFLATIVAFSTRINAQQTDNYCYVMKVALASGETAFAPFRGTMDRDSFSWDVKTDILQGSEWEKGRILLDKDTTKNVNGRKFRVQTMYFTSKTMGLTNNDRKCDDSTYLQFQNYVKAFHDRCFPEFQTLDFGRAPDVLRFGQIVLSKNQFIRDGNYAKFREMLGESYITFTLEKPILGPSIRIQITFTSITTN